MSLIILSVRLESQDNTFKSVALASLRAKLDFSSRENSLREDGAIEVWVSKRCSNNEKEDSFFSMDIHSEKWVVNSLSTFILNEEKYYPLAGTDNTPSNICYWFSLAYLRLCPEQMICIYDWVFNLDDIELYNKNNNWEDNWYCNFKKIDRNTST